MLYIIGGSTEQKDKKLMQSSTVTTPKKMMYYSAHHLDLTRMKHSVTNEEEAFPYQGCGDDALFVFFRCVGFYLFKKI